MGLAQRTGVASAGWHILQSLKSADYDSRRMGAVDDSETRPQSAGLWLSIEGVPPQSRLWLVR
jgi:hypothetical protein